MYTGTSKKAVVIKTAKNSIFEEAYFILKDDVKVNGESEMIREANKILKKYFPDTDHPDRENAKKQNKRKNGMLFFLAGALLSFVLCTLIFLVLK